jgi:hypothetical protein
MEEGELIPGGVREQRQRFCRLYNPADGVYRTVLFAQERGRDVRLEPVGAAGVRIVTREYEDLVFINDERATENLTDAQFQGRVGWIRRETSGRISACVPDGESISALGMTIAGRGPWWYDDHDSPELSVASVPRPIQVQRSPHP